MSSRMTRLSVGLILLALHAAACGGGDVLGSVELSVGDSPPSGHMPGGLPSRLLVGLYAQHDDTWMASSGVPWDARFRFLVRGWSDNFGFGPGDGAWARTYMDQADAQGEIPVFAYSVLMTQPGADSLSKVQSAATMADYFADFRLLMQRASEFGKPVVVVVENSELAYLEQAARHNASVAAAVASSGLPELSGLPDTLAGWGLAFLKLRRSAGAMNVKLAMDVATWTSGLDVARTDTSVPLEPEVNRAWAFLGPMGLEDNVVGDTYDLLSQHVADKDADFEKLVEGRDVWLDASAAASTSSRSFNRYLAWLTLWNRRAARRWVIWEIPVGNSNHLNVDNTGQPGEGYRDNWVEWLFGPDGGAHRSAMVRAGVGGLMCGLALATQASVMNDVYTDGQLFMKTRAGAFLSSGGLALP